MLLPKTITIFLLCSGIITGYTQRLVSVEGHSTNSPVVKLSAYYGNQLLPIDSVIPNDNGNFELTVLVDTGYFLIEQGALKKDIILALGEQPNIQINQTTISVLNSNENKTLDYLKSTIKAYNSRISNLQFLLENPDINSNEVTRLNKEINNLENEKTVTISDALENSPESYAVKTTQQYLYHQQVLNRDTYFSNTPAESDMLNSSLYPYLFMDYLKRFTDYNEDGFKNSVSNILNFASQNTQVYEFTLEYLLLLFESVGPKAIYDYIVEDHILKDGCTDGSPLKPEILEGYLKLKVGAISPDVLFEGTNLHDIAAEQSLTLLFFWSSHCPFCSDAIEDLIPMYSDYASRGFKIVSFSLDTDIDAYNSKNEAFPWISHCDLKGWKSEVVRTFKVTKTPTFYLLDNQSRIILKNSSIESIRRECKNRLE